MTFTITVGTFGNPNRLQMFLSSLVNTIGIDSVQLIIINSKEENKKINELVYSYASYFRDIFIKNVGINDPISPGRLVHWRVEICKTYVDDSTIFCLFDDDYQFSPNWLNVSQEIFNDNSDIHYLSLLCPGTNNQYPEITVNNYPFIKVDCAMGGSMMMRWNIFKFHFDEFVKKYGIDNNFDDIFWQIPLQMYREKYFIYMLKNKSLYQHCDLISDYNRTGHMFGVNWENYLYISKD